MAARSLFHGIAITVLTASAFASGARAESDAPPPPVMDATFVAMPELVVPIVDGDRADGRLKIKIVLRAADAAAAARLKVAIPALRETALASASEFARLRASPYKPVDVARLSHGMTSLLRPRNADVSSVLLVEVSARPA